MPIYTMDDVRLLHIHVPKTGGTSITERFFGEGWTIAYHTRFEDTRSSNYPEPAQHFHYEILTKCKVFDLSFEFVFMTYRHPFNRFISEYLFQNKSIEVNLNEYVKVNLDEYFKYVSTRISTSYANNHVRKQVDFYGEKVNYIKKTGR